MKRLTSAVMALIILLSGCGVIHDSKGEGQDVPISKLDLKSLDMLGSTKKAAVYFLNTNGTLTADPRFITVGQDANPAEAAIKALLEGPTNDTMISVAPAGMTLDFIEYSNAVANIYLRYNGNPMEKDKQYTMELAIANTVSDLLGATDVNIFYNGLREGFRGYASAPLKKHTGPVSEAYNNATAKYVPPKPVPPDAGAPPAQTPTPDGKTPADDVPKTKTIATVLYFVSASGGFILPEVREITYSLTGIGDDIQATNIAYLKAVINELKVGPVNSAVMDSPIESNASLTREPEIIDNGDGTYDVALHFDMLPSGVAYTESRQAQLPYAAMVYTITGFIPYVKSVHMYVNAKPAYEDGGKTRHDYVGYIGSSAPLYLQYESSGLLIEVWRSMEQGKIWSALERVRAVMQGPQTGDGSSANPVKTEEMAPSDILSVGVYNDTAYVDLSGNFKQACENMTAKSEMLLIYAIVNTATAMDGINQVQFLVEGAQTDTLAGHLCISDPFIKNYGIIKNSG